MGAKAKKAMKKQLSKASASAQKPVSSSATAAPDFLVMTLITCKLYSFSCRSLYPSSRPVYFLGFSLFSYVVLV